MKLDTTTIRLVLALLEEGSISKAAEKMGLAVAAASRRITSLEQQLGAPLFKRIPHGVRLTATGTRLLHHIRQIDHLIDRLEVDARALREGNEGRVVIGAPKAAIIQFLACDLARVRQAYPGITLQIIEENSRIIQQLLRDRVIDIGIYEKKSGFLDLERFAYRDDALVLVYSRTHFRFGPEAVGIDELLDIPVISLGKGSAILSALQRAYRSRDRLFPSNLIVSGFDTMLALVRHGLGAGLMPPAVLRSLHPEETLGTVPLEGDWCLRHYVLSCVQGQAQAQALHNVVQALLSGAPGPREPARDRASP